MYPSRREVRDSLYQWFQIPPENTLRKVYFAPWSEERIPDQTGGSGLYKLIGTPQVFPFCCETETGIPEIPQIRNPRRIPCIKHPTSGHLCWVVCKCVECGKKWSCVSFNRQPYCMKCRNNLRYIQELETQAEICKLFCGWELSIPELWDVYETDWYNILRQCAIRFAWKRAQQPNRWKYM